MKTQISNLPVEPGLRYSGVYQQQGRMLTDADWNELVETLKGRLTQALASVIGSGAPSEGGVLDFTVQTRPEIGVDLNMQSSVLRDGGIAIVEGLEARISLGHSVSLTDKASPESKPVFQANTTTPRIAGAQKVRDHLYDFEAERLRAELATAYGAEAVQLSGPDAVTSTSAFYFSQAALPGPPGKPPFHFQLYLDVWERTVTALEDPTLADPALHGADTTTRTQVVAQVKWAPLLVQGEDPVVSPQWNPARGSLRLHAWEQGPGTAALDDPCVENVSLDAQAQNFLLRVEVHDYVLPLAAVHTLVVKWSRENGAEAYAVQNAPEEFTTDRSQTVFEFFNDVTEKHIGVHLADGRNSIFRPQRGQLFVGWPSSVPAGYPFVRRWDGYAELSPGEPGTAWVVKTPVTGAEVFGPAPASVLRVTLNGVTFDLTLPPLAEAANASSGPVVGDYWLVRVRSEAPPGQRVQVASTLPTGVVHHYLPLFGVLQQGLLGQRIETLHPSDSERAKHFRRLRFPHFSQLNLEAVDAITDLIDGLRTDVNARVKKAGDTMTGDLKILAAASIGPIATGFAGRLEVSGGSGELTLWRRGLELPDFEKGSRFVWYSKLDPNEVSWASLYTDATGDLLSVDSDGNAALKGALSIGPIRASLRGQLSVSGEVGELALWRQDLTTAPAQVQAGDRFVWCSKLENNVARASLFTDDPGDKRDLLSVDLDGNAWLKGALQLFSASVGPIATRDPERLEASGPNGGLTLWKRGLNLPSDSVRGNRFVWHNTGGGEGKACLETNLVGNVLSVDALGDAWLKGALTIGRSRGGLQFGDSEATMTCLDVPGGQMFLLENFKGGSGGGGSPDYRNGSIVLASNNLVFLRSVETILGDANSYVGDPDHAGRVRIHGGSIGTNGLQPRLTGRIGIHTQNLEAEGTVYAQNTKVQEVDLAENYLTKTALDAGDVVRFDTDTDTVTLTRRPHDPYVCGIISTRPGVLLGEGTHPPDAVVFPVALSGRVPCKVVAENGPIHRGDLLTSSSVSGHAMRAVSASTESDTTTPRAGTIIGKALGTLESGTGVIDVFVFLR
jgi:hypothetical protein